jgi:DNA-binding protein YbaB
MKKNQELLKQVQEVQEKAEKLAKYVSNINLGSAKTRVDVQIDWTKGQIAISQ